MNNKIFGYLIQNDKNEYLNYDRGWYRKKKISDCYVHNKEELIFVLRNKDELWDEPTKIIKAIYNTQKYIVTIVSPKINIKGLNLEEVVNLIKQDKS
jgi:hypothetical protein